ncbi:MAG: NUDIX hydrolase [Omnitrophica WOR_2 bacterium]
MPFLGVNVAIFVNGKILLTKREDFEVWCLPGGAVDDGETLAQAAVREAREETGLEVELTRLVGVYSMPLGMSGGSHVILFAARVVGGVMRPCRDEVIDMGFFEPGAIPEPLFHGTQQRVLDAMNGVGGSVAWRLSGSNPFDETMRREDIYRMRDQSHLTRQEFYLKHFKAYFGTEDRLEVPPVD